MMKSTLIKDLYGEIDRLKVEVYAACEKNGVYMPKERYYQEECERKAMADHIEQMGVTIENHQKQFEELRAKFDAEVLNSLELSIKLDATEKNLDQTSKLLANTEEEVKRCQYALSERDSIISEQKKAENALAHQARVLRVDLEKSPKDNASLFSKIGREDKLNADNRSVMDNYQAELTRELCTLCNIVAASISEQNEHLQCIEKFCNSFSDVIVKAIRDLDNAIIDTGKKKLTNDEAEIGELKRELQTLKKMLAAAETADSVKVLVNSFTTQMDTLIAANIKSWKIFFKR